MSLPTHVAVDLARYERGEMNDSEVVQFFADAIIAGASLAVPPDVVKAIAEAVDDGTLSSQGDVLRWPGEGEGVYETPPK